MNERTKAITRLCVVMVLALNGLLTVFGVSPVSNEQAYSVVSDFAMILSAVWVWWKNNNVTEAAAESQGFLNALKDKDTMDELSNVKSDDLEWYEDGEV